MARDLALVVDWFAKVGGAERVLREVAQLYPDAPIHALFAEPGAAEALGIDPARVRTSYLGRLPGALKLRQLLLPLFADAVQSLDVGGAATVVSLSHAVAKNVPLKSWQRHACYLYTPMRYAHDMMTESVRGVPMPLRPAARRVLRQLAVWDVASSARVHSFAAISQTVAQRARHVYGREASVIYPPVSLPAGPPAERRVADAYYVVLSRLVAIKRIDLAVRAAALAQRRLIVVGDGPERGALRALARDLGAGGRIEFTGRVDERRKDELLAGARALLFPGEEDLGLVGVEAHAAGTPVIAFGRGGMLDVLGVPGEWHRDESPRSVPGGVIVSANTPEALARGIAHFESQPPPGGEALMALARRFEPAEFRRRFTTFVDAATTATG